MLNTGESTSVLVTWSILESGEEGIVLHLLLLLMTKLGSGISTNPVFQEVSYCMTKPE